MLTFLIPTVNHWSAILQPLPPLLEGSVGDIQRKSDDFAKNSKQANVYTTANKDKVSVRKQDKAEDRKFYNPFKSPYPTSKTPPMATKKPFKPPFPAVPGESSAVTILLIGDDFLGGDDDVSIQQRIDTQAHFQDFLKVTSQSWFRR